MPDVRVRTVLSGSFVALVSAFLGGCSSQGTVQEGDPGKLTTLANAYIQATEKTGRPPKGPADLKAFLPKGTDVDGLLASPNDGKPHVILWGQDPRKLRGTLKPGVIGYEQDGKGGRRFVFTAMGVMLMTDDDFAQANFPEGHRP